MNILIVDDDDDWIKLVFKWMENSDYDIKIIKGGFEAIRELQINKYDMAIIDLFMPEISGIKLGEYVKKTFKIPVIVMSAIREVENYNLKYKYMKPNNRQDYLEIINTVSKDITFKK